MKYVHGFFCILFGCFGVIALAASPFVLIASDPLACLMMLTIATFCGILSISFHGAQWEAERRELDRQWWEARRNG